MNSSIILEIDYREKAILKYIEDNKLPIQYSIVNLPIGDFVFKSSVCSNNIIYILERKTISDLESSIIDGRFREQKQRLLDSVSDSTKVIYILEGQYIGNSLPKTTIHSSILNLIFKHKYKVINTSNHIETCEMLLSVYKKLETNEFEQPLESKTCQLIKKKTSLNNNILIHMLSVIPGISINIAKKIYTVYPSIPELVHAYNQLNETNKREDMLSNIQINEKRKLGKALSKKIYNALYLQKNKIIE